jgi:hypothetical protein
VRLSEFEVLVRERRQVRAEDEAHFLAGSGVLRLDVGDDEFYEVRAIREGRPVNLSQAEELSRWRLRSDCGGQTSAIRM